MSWWGKMIGGAFGFMLGGPLGALLGAALGHNFDKGLNSFEMLGVGDQERVQTAFFTATFSIMGHIAKADGRVTPDEIQMAKNIFNHLQLNDEQRKAAIALFNEGKQADFPFDDVLEQFRNECHRRTSLFRMFVEIQLNAAYADGQMHKEERKVINKIANKLGISKFVLQQLEALIQAQTRHQTGSAPVRSSSSLKEAYEILGVTPEDDKAKITRAYRKLMNQHHPDKLVSKGLPEEMMKLAAEKTHEIRTAYETIKKARDF
ncbi:MAG: co-chaperone DjlA [Gammaproteobacteria bacterium]|nr:co-chaperone DjlA [Gammaproteobacteria bacterium]